MIEIKAKTSEAGNMDLKFSVTGPGYVIASEAAAIITRLSAEIGKADPELFELMMDMAEKQVDKMFDDEEKEAEADKENSQQPTLLEKFRGKRGGK